jgi:hypothetical protein
MPSRARGRLGARAQSCKARRVDFKFRSRETYWLTRFVVLRLLGLIYVIAFLAAVQQLVPLIGSDGLTPVKLYLPRVADHFGSSFDGFWNLPTLFWFNCSDPMLRLIPWIGLILACALAAGFGNSIMLAVLWVLYLSIVHAGQDWYSFGWETQLTETGFLAIFLVPLLDARPFPARPPPYVVIVLLRWLVVRIMLGSGLIKLRGDAWWHDGTALNYFFETQPIPNPLSVYFHFLPHSILAVGVAFTFFVELVVPWFAFWPRPARLAAGLIMISLQLVLIVGGNFAFLNWLTIVAALACLDDRFLRRFLPGQLVAQATQARTVEKRSVSMEGASYALGALVACLSIPVVLNLCSPNQRMIEYYEPFDLVGSYGVFGTVTQNPGWTTRHVIIFEGTSGTDPDATTGWKEYRWLAQPSDPAVAPIQIAPYQPHLDWQLWFAPMGSPADAPWAVTLVAKLLHNDPLALSLIGPNPFPHAPPRYIRVVSYTYQFAEPGNPQHVYWRRERKGLWLRALSIDDPGLTAFLDEGENWP